MAELDGQLSIGQMSLNALIELTSETRSMRESFQKLLQLQNRYQTEGPINVQLRDTGTSASTGNLTLGLGGPSQGRKWELRRLIIGGANYGNTVAGTAEIYVTAVPASVVAVGRNLADMVDQASGATPALPSIAFYGTGQIVLRYPQEIKIVIVGPTASTQYNAGGAAVDLPDLPASAVQGV